MREATGSAVPDPLSRVREDEMAILPAIEFQLAQGSGQSPWNATCG
jgi:hypothetical protein